MKLCNVCLKTFKDNYALNRHINKQKKCTSIKPTKDSLFVDDHLQLMPETDNNEKKLIIIKSKDKHNGHNDIPKTSIIDQESLIDTTSTVKTILIKKCELNAKNDTIIRNKPNNNNNKICNIKLNAKLEQLGELYNCSLCKVEFKHKNNFYRHKKKCVILTTHQ